jgi:hypothetical protein
MHKAIPPIILLISCFLSTHSKSQSNAADFVPGASTVKLDASTLDMGDLPFDNPGVIQIINIPKIKDLVADPTGKTDIAINQAQVMIVEGNSITHDGANSDSAKIYNSGASVSRPVFWKRFGDAFYIVIVYDQVWNKEKRCFYKKNQFFKPNTTYVLRIVFYKTIKSKDGKSDSAKYITAIERSNHIRTKFGDYLKADFGFAHVPNINGTIGFTSVHVHFAPVNYDADLGKIASFSKELPMRLSAFFGISPLTIYSDTKVPITKLSAAGNFIYGIGLRSPFYGWYGEHRIPRTILQPMRLDFGNMVFTQSNASPLITTPVYLQSWYIGMSYDFTLLGLFGPISKLVSP